MMIDLQTKLIFMQIKIDTYIQHCALHHTTQTINWTPDLETLVFAGLKSVN